MFSSGPPEYYPETMPHKQRDNMVAPIPKRPTVVPYSQFMQAQDSDGHQTPSTGSPQMSGSSWDPLPPLTHFLQSPATRDFTSPSRPSSSRRPDTEGPYYRASKPWHRQEFPNEPDTPMNRHINNIMLEKLLEHTERNTCSGWSPLWTKARMCKHWICLECDEIPLQPVATSCGHTICRSCAERINTCQCGAPLPEPLVINVAIRALVEELAPQNEYLRHRVGYTDLRQLETISFASAAIGPSVLAALHDKVRPSTSTGLSEGLHQFFSRPESPSQDSSSSSSTFYAYRPASSGVTPANFSMALPSPWDVDVNFGEVSQPRPYSADSEKFEAARDLVASGHDEQAVPYLAGIVNHGSGPLVALARDLIRLVIKKQHQNVLVRNLRGLILRSDAKRLMQLQDLMCVLCSSKFRRPVTTPCGHTYCRTCIERSLDYAHTCPLCCRSLLNFNVDSTQQTAFLTRFFEVAGHTPEPEEPEVPADEGRLPIFVCTIAYPMVPCPLFVFEPRYRLMIRRCLRSGQRRFGIVGTHPLTGYVDYGTILEVRDSVRLSDGRHIISTIGISRFRIVERAVRDGYDIARVERLQDDRTPLFTPHTFGQLHRSLNIRMRAETWLRSMDEQARAEVEMTFGSMPPLDHGGWSPDGPAWLWWVLALLPLDSNLKLMILANQDVRKRMAVVERTLEIMALFGEPSPTPGGPQPAATQPPAQLRTTSLFDACLQRAA